MNKSVEAMLHLLDENPPASSLQAHLVPGTEGTDSLGIQPLGPSLP